MIKLLLVSVIIYFNLIALESYAEPSDPTDNLRIVSGRKVNITEVPFVVLITMVKGIKEGLCTGSIIAEEWVLTAAHCVDESEPMDIKVIAGTSSKRRTKKNETTKRDVIEIVTHPWYQAGRAVKWDYALLKVDPFTLGQSIGILELGGDQWPQDDRMYARPCTAVGWGMTSQGNKRTAGQNLNIVNVTAEHGEKACKCLRKYQKKRVVCLKTGTTKGVCGGDSGGPLLCDGKGYGVAHVIYDRANCGRMLWEPVEPKCGKRTTIGAYSYICPVLDWIHQYASNQPKRPKSCRASNQNFVSNEFILFFFFFILIL